MGGRLWEGLRGVQLRSVMIEVSVEEGRRESFGTGWPVVGGMTAWARRSFLNQREECFAIYPHERRERLG